MTGVIDLGPLIAGGVSTGSTGAVPTDSTDVGVVWDEPGVHQ